MFKGHKKAQRLTPYNECQKTNLSQGFKDSSAVGSQHFQFLFILQPTVGHDSHQCIADVMIRFPASFHVIHNNEFHIK